MLALNSVGLINAILFAENNFALWVAFGILFAFVYIILSTYFITKKNVLGLLAYGLGKPLACDDTLGSSDTNSTGKAPVSWSRLTPE